MVRVHRGPTKLDHLFGGLYITRTEVGEACLPFWAGVSETAAAVATSLAAKCQDRRKGPCSAEFRSPILRGRIRTPYAAMRVMNLDQLPANCQNGHMDAFTIVVVWLLGICSGGLLCIGIIEIARGQAVISLSRSTWSVGENRVSGVCTTIQGAAVAIYAVFGGLTLGAHAIPLFWVGHWWGIFAPAPLAVIMLGTLFVQAYLQIRHENRRRVART
jgi:hypothetical protein